ncbi:MAG TPA: DNA-formamidopyrimidine glycosylase family protein [Planctomycetota bacterium]|nr:DNA-formamidopyrimidine glycosylase family protein [Planctomycetota bacterium]
MPELPDLELYRHALRERAVGLELRGLRIPGPFLLRTVDPAPDELVGRRIEDVERLGKRLVFVFEGARFAVLHLMIAGRLRWSAPDAALPARLGQAAFDLEGATLIVTEAGTKRRASLHLVRGRADLSEHDRGGLEPLDCDLAAFAERLTSENHTLKRALTDPRLFSGIGNAYSDEILHAAQLSPLVWTTRLDTDQVARLHAAVRATLAGWSERLTAEAGGRWPTKVTAFREGMAVHGRFREPCPVCGTAVQRIVWSENECNYCPRCQTGGRLLADRALSRLLKQDWPRTIEELDRNR